MNSEEAKLISREHEFDARIRAKLNRSFAPPAHLKALLLEPRGIPRKRVSSRNFFLQMAAAACFALFLAVAAFWIRRQRPVDFARYREEMTALALKGLNPPESVVHDFAEVKNWRARVELERELTMPKKSNGQPELNCRAFEWKGNEIFIICFETQNHKRVHLLVTDRTAWKNPPSEMHSFHQAGALATLAWSHEDKTWLAISKDAGETELRALF